MAESIAAYAQPLIDATDGSTDQMNSALAMAQMCWNLALLPEKDLADSLVNMRSSLKMDDTEFAGFLQSVIGPMVRRHHEMFPNMPRMESKAATPSRREEKFPGTGRNAPCPCNSGKKYKRCCGQ